MMFFSLIKIEQVGTKTENAIINQIAHELGATPEEIIVKDISETSGFFFKTVKNEGLREVYYKGEKYLVQVEADKVLKITEKPPTFTVGG